jgi:hypothetical protein
LITLYLLYLYITVCTFTINNINERNKDIEIIVELLINSLHHFDKNIAPMDWNKLIILTSIIDHRYLKLKERHFLYSIPDVDINR